MGSVKDVGIVKDEVINSTVCAKNINIKELPEEAALIFIMRSEGNGS